MNNYSFFNLCLHIKDRLCDLFEVVLGDSLLQRPLNAFQHFLQVFSFDEFENLVNFPIGLKYYVYDSDDVFMTALKFEKHRFFLAE